MVTLLNLDDSVLELYDSDRTTQLAQNDDFENTLASALDWTCPRTGTYYIKVRGYDGSSTGTFSLAVQANGYVPGGPVTTGDACATPLSLSGSGEIDFTDSYSDNTVCQWILTCEPGNEVAVTIDTLDVEQGYDYLDIMAGNGAAVAHLTGSTLPNPATFTSAGQNTATISFTSDESVASRGFHLSYACSVSSGQTAGGACTPVTVGARPREGNIDTAGSSITYCLSAAGGTTYQIAVDLETLADSNLILFAPDGQTQLAENDDYGSGLSSYLEWTAPADGVYQVRVEGYATETGTFLLSIDAGSDDPCGASGVTLTEDNGDIFFSNSYEEGETCHWTVTCNDGSPTLDFQAFDTESDYDFVTVMDGPTSRAPQLVHLSGSLNTLPQSSVTATGSSMYVEFTADDSVGGQGFDASWECRRTGGGGGGAVTAQTAAPLTPGRPVAGNVVTAGAPVAYSLAAEGGVTYEVDVALQTLGDSVLQILDRDGQTVLSENDDYGDGLSSHITWTAPLSGTYFVSVSGYATETGSFTVSVTANTGTAGGATGDPCNGGLTLASRSDVISYRPRGQYEQNAMCSWEINCGTDQVTWTFTNFDTEGGFDFVKLFEGQCDECAQDTPLASLSGGMGDLEQLSFYSQGPAMTIQFSSDSSVSKDGFEGSYECGTPPPWMDQIGEGYGWTTFVKNWRLRTAGDAQGAALGRFVATSLWAPPRHAQVSLYRPFANARCSDRDDICGADQPPCRDARSEDDCKAACRVDDSCLSASISPDGGCHLSQTCGAGGDGSGSVTANTGTVGGATGDPCNGGLTLASRSDVISYRPRGQYEQNAMCSWEINCGTDQVTWTFTNFDTEGGFDFVKLFEGQCDECAQDTPLASLSGGMGDLEQLSFYSQGPAMTIQFSSDGSVSNDGFEGSYECGTPPASPWERGRENTHTPPPPPPSTGSPGTVNHHGDSASECEDGSSPISENAKLSDAQINALGSGREKIFKLVSPGENLEPRATYYLRSESTYTDTAPGMGLLPIQWSLDWQSGGWSAPNPACAENPADCFDTFGEFGQQNGGNTCNRIFTDYSGEPGCYPLTGQRCFSDGFECGHQLISDFELRIQTPLCTGPGVVAMSPPGVPRFSARCDAEGFAKVLQVHSAAYTPSANAIAAASITQCNSGANRVGPLYCSSITPYSSSTGVHCDAANAGCNAFGQTTGPGTGTAGGALQCVQAVGASQRLWSDRQYAWTDGPSDILDGVWSYVMVPLEAGSGAPCPTEGGFRGAVAEEATVAVCCANHCAGNPVPTGANGWQEHPGQWSIDGHPGTPCTFFETR